MLAKTECFMLNLSINKELLDGEGANDSLVEDHRHTNMTYTTHMWMQVAKQLILMEQQCSVWDEQQLHQNPVKKYSKRATVLGRLFGEKQIKT